MLRVTVLGLALAISLAACTKKEGASNADSGMGAMPPAGAESTTAPSATDTMGGMAPESTTGAMAPESTSTSSATGAIDTMANKTGATVDSMASKAKAAAGAGAAAVGGAASSAELQTKLSTLSKDQLKELQSALNSDGCDVGTPDGVMGTKTVQGVQCSMKKHNVNDLDSLYQALNLNFSK